MKTITMITILIMATICCAVYAVDLSCSYKLPQSGYFYASGVETDLQTGEVRKEWEYQLRSSFICEGTSDNVKSDFASYYYISVCAFDEYDEIAEQIGVDYEHLSDLRVR